MAQLIVLSFKTEDEASSLREALKEGSKQGLISLDDAAVVTKDPDGKVHVKNEVSRGTKIGAGVGGLLGLLLGAIFFPVAGILVGVAGGALVGRIADLGVDGKFVKEVGEQIEPGSSALFVLVHDANPTAAMAIFREHKGTVLQTTLPSDIEDNLRKAMEEADNQ